MAAEETWDPATGLGSRSWPWLAAMGLFLFLLLLWALRGESSGSGEPPSESGYPEPMEAPQVPRAREEARSPPSSSPAEPPPPGPSFPAEAEEVEEVGPEPLPFPGALPQAEEAGDLPPRRVLAELPAGPGREEEARIRRALRLLEESPLCLADPPVQVEPDRDGGKIRVFFWVPGFASPGEIQELASRLESL